MQLSNLVPLLQVYDMNESIAFYRDLLGFEIVRHSPEIEAAEGRYFHWAWLSHGDASLMLNTAHDANERPPARDLARDRGHDDIGLYMICADIDAAFAGLTALGVALEPPSGTPYGMRQLSLRDPDGYGISLQWRAPGGDG
jgi:catechol 2,3-dioxygenase-like lactoylglutathione lyase family enzyme